MPAATHSIPEILEKLHLEPLNSGACFGDWIANPSGGELASLNPATGETIKIAAKRVVKFRVAKAAKDAILGGKK